MKRLIILYLSTFLLSNPVYGDDNLTKKQREQYNKSKLTIELFKNKYGYNSNYSAASAGELRSWNAYLGSLPLEETELFKLAENQFEYDQAVVTVVNIEFPDMQDEMQGSRGERQEI